MIGFEIIMLGLLIISTVTGLVTEAVKKVLKEYNVKCRTNSLTGIVAAILSTAISIGYVVVNSIEFTPQVIVYMIAMIFMSWLCSMVGYDKVVQTISQFKQSNKE